ncbi:MAG: DUF2312 domain-containing protein [Alphaproteobacteria bacterium]|nr:DUF2312 domain-containing protein [Alphaproteobacteria bacterium]OJV46990.1 MAG: hypothetical protein BGO28_06600 [Alphaproteobacteria bacterium 43-37]
MTTDVAGVSGARLKAYIEKIERLEEEKSAIQSDIRDVFAEAKATGFDTKVMRQLLKIRKMKTEEVEEQETLLDVYKTAIGMVPNS